jgi:hypothetical protein
MHEVESLALAKFTFHIALQVRKASEFSKNKYEEMEGKGGEKYE